MVEILTESEIKEIISKDEMTTVQAVLLIRQFIYDKKGENVEIEQPNNAHHFTLMRLAFDTAKKYYLEVMEKKDEEII